jgi:hypothetical protein
VELNLQQVIAAANQVAHRADRIITAGQACLWAHQVKQMKFAFSEFGPIRSGYQHCAAHERFCGGLPMPRKVGS